MLEVEVRPLENSSRFHFIFQKVCLRRMVSGGTLGKTEVSLVKEDRKREFPGDPVLQSLVGEVRSLKLLVTAKKEIKEEDRKCFILSFPTAVHNVHYPFKFLKSPTVSKFISL